MSSQTSNDLRSALSNAGSVVRPMEAVLFPVRVLAFWTAIALPFLYVPLLFSGLENAATTVTFLALLACNATALLVGHPHRRT